MTSFKRLCTEFRVSQLAQTSASKREHGLGSVFIYVTNLGPPVTSISYPGREKFSDEDGKATKGNLIYIIRNDNKKLKTNLTSSWQTNQKAWIRLVRRDWIGLLSYSYNALLVLKSMSDHQSWAHQAWGGTSHRGHHARRKAAWLSNCLFLALFHY